VANIFFTAAPSGADFVGGGTANGTATASIIPWMRNGATGLITYDATKGLQNLTGQLTTLATSGSNQNNYALSSAPSALTGNLTINSLVFNIASTLDTAGNTLKVTSGAIATGLSATIGTTANPGTLDFGTAEGSISVAQARRFIINSVITGSGGLTITGFRPSSSNADVVLAGANIYTGVTTLNNLGGASMVVHVDNSLAFQNTTVTDNAGVTLSFGGNDTFNGVTISQNITSATFGGLAGSSGIALTNIGPAGGGVALTVGGDNDNTT
jgi:hypothetical protein